MKRILFTSILALILNLPFAQASKVTVGDGKYEQEGCNGLDNITGNLPEGYTVSPKVTWDDNIWVCGKFKEAGSMVEILKKVALRLDGCLSIQINEAQKTVQIIPQKNVKNITQTTTSSTSYLLNGKEALVVPETSVRKIRMCVLDKDALDDMAPYNQFIK
jgi:hypothetical protein